MRKIAVLLCLSFIAFTVVFAQDRSPLPEPQRVEIPAADGLKLIGDFYAVSDSAAPTVILLHGIGGNRHNWDNAIPSFLDNGYNVLAVDQRANGETGGDRDLVAAIGDVQIWLDWLKQQSTVDAARISTIGSSWGAVTALAGCAADTACVTAIAISPGDFPLLDQAMFDRMQDRSVLFIVGRKDNVLYDTRKLFDRASGEAALHVYNTGAHGNAFFLPGSRYKDSITHLILTWLGDHNAA